MKSVHHLFPLTLFPSHLFHNKTKYFRLRLSDEVGTERPETDLRLTWDWPKTDLGLTWDWPETDLRQTYERKMKIQWLIALCAGRTDRRTEWLLGLLDGAKKSARQWRFCFKLICNLLISQSLVLNKYLKLRATLVHCTKFSSVTSLETTYTRVAKRYNTIWHFV